MASNKIPAKINLSADDPFVMYLGFMYNTGIDYMAQSEKMLVDVGKYKDNLDGYMKNTKLQFLLGEK